MEYNAHKEERFHLSTTLPYTYYSCKIPDYFTHVPAHWHSEFELNYVIEGSARFKVGTEEFLTQPGDIILIQPDEIHAISQDTNRFQNYDTLVFNLDFLRNLEGERSSVTYINPLIHRSLNITPCIHSGDPQYEQLRAVVENIFTYVKQDNALSDLRIKSCLIELIWLLLSNNYCTKNTTTRGLPSDLESIRPVLQYIATHFRNDIKISDLANIIHRSESYLMIYFHNVIGFTAMEYITQLRIKAACEQLRTTNDLILEIAYDCGFKNLSNFNRHFKRIMGMTPMEYKKKVETEIGG